MISFIYKLQRLWDIIEKTYAYTKIDQDKFFMVSVTKHPDDYDNKIAARKFATEKLNRIRKLYDATGGRLVAKGKNSYRILSHDELMVLKKKIQFHNDIHRQIVLLLAKERRGYKKYEAK